MAPTKGTYCGEFGYRKSYCLHYRLLLNFEVSDFVPVQPCHVQILRGYLDGADRPDCREPFPPHIRWPSYRFTETADGKWELLCSSPELVSHSWFFQIAYEGLNPFPMKLLRTRRAIHLPEILVSKDFNWCLRINNWVHRTTFIFVVGDAAAGEASCFTSAGK